MRFACVLLAFVAAVSGASALTDVEYQSEFISYMSTYGKSYDSNEVFSRFDLFKKSLDEVSRHNTQSETYQIGINQFSDATSQEMKHILGARIAKSGKKPSTITSSSVSANPASVDWSAANKISAVKNQGQCGSCWAFSSTGAIEGQNAIRYNNNVTALSEQQLVDCSWDYDNEGCDGGWMDSAFEYVIDNGGLATEVAYPYTYANGVTKPASVCKTNITKVSTISGYFDVDENSEQALEDAITKGPVSVAIDAGSFFFQLYSKGVFSGPCGTDLNHGVLAVGYGVDAATGKKYWLVKNSWGTTWGEKGYIKLERVAAKEGLCGIQMAASGVVV